MCLYADFFVEMLHGNLSQMRSTNFWKDTTHVIRQTVSVLRAEVTIINDREYKLNSMKSIFISKHKNAFQWDAYRRLGGGGACD